MGSPDDAPNTAKVVYCKNPVLRKSAFAGMLLNGKGRPLNLDGPSHTIPATAGGNRTHIVDEAGALQEYHFHLSDGPGKVAHLLIVGQYFERHGLVLAHGIEHNIFHAFRERPVHHLIGAVLTDLRHHIGITLDAVGNSLGKVQ